QAGIDFGVGMTPEFLKEGVAVKDFFQPDRIVIGSQDKKSTNQLKKLFSTFTCPQITTSLSAAEMIKYASNAFLATKISFINEIGNMCKTINIDTYEVAEGMGHDHRIGRAFLNAGLGWGGSCFPKDVKALHAWAQKHHNDTHMLKATITVNDTQPKKMIQLLKKHLPDLKGKTIGILGLAFKPDTDDIRESRAIPLIQTLIKEHAIIKVYDPMAMNNFKTLFPTIDYCTTAEETLDADATLIVTKWEEFTTLNYKNKLIIDGRRLDQAQQGIYEGICW
ncbi:nucleotide sugar dehydrogenase, partial [bacterium]|nr:nucleotide sugar dehydrogenase [bacterium]